MNSRRLRVKHGDFLPYALSEPPTGPCSSLPQLQRVRPAGPWGKPEMFLNRDGLPLMCIEPPQDSTLAGARSRVEGGCAAHAHAVALQLIPPAVGCPQQERRNLVARIISWEA